MRAIACLRPHHELLSFAVQLVGDLADEGDHMACTDGGIRCAAPSRMCEFVPFGASVRNTTSNSMIRSAVKASISQNRSVLACFSIASIRAIPSSVMIISIWFNVPRPVPNPKIGRDRQFHQRPCTALRQGLAHPLTPTDGTWLGAESSPPDVQAE